MLPYITIRILTQNSEQSQFTLSSALISLIALPTSPKRQAPLGFIE